MLLYEAIQNITGFERMWAFSLLLLLPLFYALVYFTKQTTFEHFRYPDIENIKHNAIKKSPNIKCAKLLRNFYLLRKSRRAWLLALSHIAFLLSYFLVIIALACPYGRASFDSRKQGLDVIFVLDMSSSMKAYDYSLEELQARSTSGQPLLNRFETATKTIKQFVDREAQHCSPNDKTPRCDRIGMVIFGNLAYLDIPLTTNYNLVKTLINRRSLDDIQSTQTAIGDGISRAVASLRHTGTQDRIIILLTDGDKKGGRMSIAQGIQAANDNNVTIFPILIGSKSETYVRVEQNGDNVYRKAEYPTNFPLLQSIAEKTGGIAYQSSNDIELLESFDAILDRLEKGIVDVDDPSDHLDYSRIFLLYAFIFILINSFFRRTIARVYP